MNVQSVGEKLADNTRFIHVKKRINYSASSWLVQLYDADIQLKKNALFIFHVQQYLLLQFFQQFSTQPFC